MEIFIFWLQILRPNVIVFLANLDFQYFRLPLWNFIFICKSLWQILMINIIVFSANLDFKYVIETCNSSFVFVWRNNARLAETIFEAAARKISSWRSFLWLLEGYFRPEYAPKHDRISFPNSRTHNENKKANQKPITNRSPSVMRCVSGWWFYLYVLLLVLLCSSFICLLC